MITKSSEDYLETILMIEKSGEKIKSVMVANKLGVTRPAVNRAMNELKEGGYITKLDYGDIVLTELGRSVAEGILAKHHALKEFLIILGVSETIAENDSCKIEHVVSEETAEQIKKFVNIMKNA